MAKAMRSEAEQIVGKPASFKVWYRRGSKLYWDVMWAPGTDEAERKVLAFARELRWRNVSIVRTERVDPVVG